MYLESAAERPVVRFIPCGTNVQFIEMLTVGASRFEEDAREYEIAIKVPPKRAEAAA